MSPQNDKTPMFCGWLGGMLAAFIIPVAQVWALFLIISNTTISQGAAIFMMLLVSAFQFIGILLFTMLWISNMVIWARFCKNRRFGPNFVISLAVPAMPALAIDWLSHTIDQSHSIIVAYSVPFIGYLLMAILAACGSTGRGLAYDFGLMIEDRQT